MKYVLVTGAYGGMGIKTVEKLVENGCHVFALDRKIGEAKEGITPVQADVTNEESLKNAMEQVQKITPTIDAIVHFVGVYMLHSLVEMPSEDFEKIFKINAFGAFSVNKIFLPLLKKGGRILLTTSELAPLDPLPFTGIYAITKSALDKYAFSLRMELQLLNIDVCVLRAGAVQTEMLGVSTSALDRFCENTKLYECNAKRFKQIVERVEARCIPSEKLAKKVWKILQKKRTKFAYAINRNPLLLLLNALPKRWQLFAIRCVLKKKKGE